MLVIIYFFLEIYFHSNANRTRESIPFPSNYTTYIKTLFINAKTLFDSHRPISFSRPEDTPVLLVQQIKT
jgi:hypothetical protein